MLRDLEDAQENARRQQEVRLDQKCVGIHMLR